MPRINFFAQLPAVCLLPGVSNHPLMSVDHKSFCKATPAGHKSDPTAGAEHGQYWVRQTTVSPLVVSPSSNTTRYRSLDLHAKLKFIPLPNLAPTQAGLSQPVTTAPAG